MESRPSLRFVMTGSSARKIKRTGVNLLAGRAVLETMHPFMAVELGERFQLDRALRHGLVPLVLGAPDPEVTLQSYAALYLREEVQAEGLVRNLSGFARFLEAIGFSHGSPLNVADVARDCQVERKVVEGYVSVLEDLLLGVRLPAFNRRGKRATTTHPKFYYFDVGKYLRTLLAQWIHCDPETTCRGRRSVAHRRCARAVMVTTRYDCSQTGCCEFATL